MNRHQRRAAAARSRDAHSAWFRDYVSHLPEVPVDAPLERGRLYHMCVFHDDWCRFYETENPAHCNCNPTVRQYAEPKRS
jgi:hypothetical protein